MLRHIPHYFVQKDLVWQIKIKTKWKYTDTYFFLKMIWNTACERDECWLADVVPDVRTLLPWATSRRTSSALVMVSSLSPTTCTWLLWSSRTRNFCFLFNKSNTCSRNQKLLHSLLTECPLLYFLWNLMYLLNSLKVYEYTGLIKRNHW